MALSGGRVNAWPSRQGQAKRRLKHPCFACRLPIDKGDRYTRTAVVTDGRLGATVEHDECANEVSGYLSGESSYEYLEGVLVEYAEREDLSPEWLGWYEARRAKGPSTVASIATALNVSTEALTSDAPWAGVRR